LTQPQTLRTRAEDVAGAFPPLLAQADQLAATVMVGEHGRRRAGVGDSFWQYRPAQLGDEARSIDWRRSARADQNFVREKEWQTAQSVQLWVDGSASMHFASEPNLVTKADRARVLSLALSILLIRGGERVGLSSGGVPTRAGQSHLIRLADALSADDVDDYGRPDTSAMTPLSRGVFVSDFMGDVDAVERALSEAATRGVRGALVQILDPQEEAFPFDGRTIFQSMGGSLQHETLKAGDLRDRYLDRLAERKDRLDRLARETGWQFMTHHTGDAASSVLLWLYSAIGQVR
jgi:uncharacterized protein (DUF58 family)